MYNSGFSKIQNDYLTFDSWRQMDNYSSHDMNIIRIIMLFGN